MGKKSKKKGYEEIPFDADPEVICGLIEAHTKYFMSSPSYSYIKKAIKQCKKGKRPLDEVFKAYGKAMFNEIMTDAIMQKIELDVGITEMGIGLEESVDDN